MTMSFPLRHTIKKIIFFKEIAYTMRQIAGLRLHFVLQFRDHFDIFLKVCLIKINFNISFQQSCIKFSLVFRKWLLILLTTRRKMSTRIM